MSPALEAIGSRSSSVSFELDRLDHTAGTRLEISGRWFGVRGRRFMRPTLTFHADGESYRLLADLEHKPWPPEEGEPWIAWFAFDGDTTSIAELELTVAPDIEISLPGPGAGKRPRAARRQPGRQDAQVAALRRELESLRRELAHGQTESEGLREQLASVQAELEGARAELERASAELERANAELEQNEAEQVEIDAALARRDAALARIETLESERSERAQGLEEIVAQRDAALQEREHAFAGRDQAVAERDQAVAERDQALAERERAVGSRDQAVAQRDRAVAERYEFARASESLQAQRDAARALAMRRNLAWHGPAWRRRAGTQPEVLRRNRGWAMRAAAIVVLIVAVLVLALIVKVF